MKNKVQIDLAKKTAECLKLRLDEADYRGFSHVADFAENAPTGDGILACSDSFVSVSADCLCRENTAKDRKPISASIARAVMNGELTVEGMIKEYLANMYGEGIIRFFDKFSSMTDENRKILLSICELIEKAEIYDKMVDLTRK